MALPTPSTDPAHPDQWGQALNDAITALFAGAAARAANLSDLSDPAAARTNLGLGSAAQQPASAFDAAGAATAAVGAIPTGAAAGTPSLRALGTTGTTAAAGNDTRLSDARTPTGAAGGALAGTYPAPTLAAGAVGTTELAASSVTLAKIAAAATDPAAGTGGLRTIGPGAQQAASGKSVLGASTRFTVADWVAARGTPYYIGHRGSGDIAPEHSVAAYDFAYNAGVLALEVSVNQAADGALYCMHDTTLDRMTGVSGNGVDFPWATIKHLPLLAPIMGAAWSNDPERPPLFEDILRRYGGRAVLICEAKYDAAYPAMIALINKYGLADSVIIKAFYTSGRIAQAKAAGFKVFDYFGTVTDITAPNIATVVASAPDYFVIPTYDSTQPSPNPLIADALVDQCVATGLPVWVYQTHRRYDAAHMIGRGVVGIVAANVPYLVRSTPVTTRDTWVTQALAPGEMIRDPQGTDPLVPPGYVSPNIARFARPTNGGKQFVLMGQLCPVAGAGSTWHVDFDWRWHVLPTDTSQHIDIAFGRADDRYYEHQLGVGNGYHFIARATGSLQLFTHSDGVTAGTQIGTTGVTMTAAPVADTWFHTRVDVTPTTVTVTQTDADGVSNPHTVTAADATRRGGYLAIGKSGDGTGVADFRNVVVS